MRNGVPNSYVLQDGDYLNVDVVCYKDGYHGDTSGMIMIGDVRPDIKKLSKVAREALYKGIEMC